MIYPSTEELCNRGGFNRYTLVIAVAKCARIVTDEYVKQRETAERLLAAKETDKSLVSLIKKEFRDEKSVRSAINRLEEGKAVIIDPETHQVFTASREPVELPEDLLASLDESAAQTAPEPVEDAAQTEQEQA